MGKFNISKLDLYYDDFHALKNINLDIPEKEIIFCKTDFDMKEIKAEEAAYVPLPKFYTFKSREERERILYKNFIQVGQDVKDMITDVLNKRGAK